MTPFGVLRQALRQVAGTTNFEHWFVFLEELSKPDYVDVTRFDARHLLQDMYTICLGCVYVSSVRNAPGNHIFAARREAPYEPLAERSEAGASVTVGSRPSQGHVECSPMTAGEHPHKKKASHGHAGTDEFPDLLEFLNPSKRSRIGQKDTSFP